MTLRDEVEQDVVQSEDKATIRRLLRDLDKARAKREELVDAVYRAARDAASGLELKPVAPPKRDERRKRSPEYALPVLSDWQLGKKTPSYTSDACEQRVETFSDKVLELTAIQRSDHPVREAHVFALGDLIEGEMIFPGQAHRIDSSLYRQVTVDGPRILANFLRRMLSSFDHVTVHAVDGNHGAIGGPVRREYHPETNGDRMLYQIVRMLFEFAGEKRISFNFPDPEGERNWFALARLGGYTSLLMHGDQFRGTAGMPWYSIQKKAGGWALGAIEEFALSMSGEGETDIDFGHYHQPTRLTLNKVTARCNGSTESYNTFAQEQLAAVGRPSQGLRFIHPEKGMVSAEYTVWLDR